MVNGSFVKERESLSCCDWFSMKLHEMMFRIKTFFDSENNFHYGQRIKRRATSRGRYSIYPWVGRCGAAPRTLTLFKTNIADFPIP